MVKPILPSLDGLNRIDSMATGEAIRALNNTMKMLTKELEHAFYNLDDENFNEVEWDNITSPIYAQIKDNEDNIASLQLIADRFDLMVSGIGSDGNVTAASIVAAVNSAGSTVKINADKIDITGTVKFLTPSDVGASGSTTISGSRITTGTLNASLCNITNLNASNIVSGTLSADYISGGEISSSKFSSVSSRRKMELTSGWIHFYDTSYAGSRYGYLYYNTGANKFYMEAANALKFSAGGNISIDAGDGSYIYIGSSGVSNTIELGDGDDTIRIKGNASFGNSSLDVTVYFYGTVNFSNATVVGL